MKSKRVVVSLACGLMMMPCIVSQAASRPYDSIANRNVFGLRPLPKVTAIPTPKTPIFLQGFTSHSRRKQALLRVGNVSLILNEKERWGTIEVIEVNQATETVKFRYSDEVQVLYLGKLPTLGRQ